MARSTQDLLDRQLAFLPDDYQSAEPLLGGTSAAMAGAEVAMDSIGSVLSFQGADGIWLELHADGYGIQRATTETDEALRARLRNVDDAVTRPAILAAVDALLLPFAAGPASMVEWFDEPFLDVLSYPGGMFLGSTFISDGASSFVVIVPVVGLGYNPPTLEDPIYAAIIAEVERLKAAGTHWALYIGVTPP